MKGIVSMSEVKNKPETIDLGFLSVSMIKPNIICVKLKDENQITLDSGIKILEAIKSIVNNGPYTCLIDMADLYVPSNDFFKFIVSQRNREKDYIVARAIVSTNMAQRIDAQNFISLYKPVVPTKLFSEINNEVFDWMDSHLKSTH